MKFVNKILKCFLLLFSNIIRLLNETVLKIINKIKKKHKFMRILNKKKKNEFMFFYN